ncbi:histidine phosphatase family protein [Rossellomorea vietnamensis]|uniref:Histidine phosphatase family protein n=1 Tax=Rossellomorea vietnamensis TaxID=218284 RepID=A0A5D4KB57_9BACI|nr:histidine phosphatase family protein [Rossellomorea vietnamensis]TYR73343.1 histidine phosphatase family protein [Rossellomorea vietnamensis]
MTVIYMIRHAHSVFNLEEEETRGLSVQGMADAVRVKDILKSEKIDAVYSSSYTRAIQTVQGLADERDLKIQVDERFRERDLAAKDYIIENPQDAMRKVFENPDLCLPGGETNNEVRARGTAAFQEVLEKCEGRSAAIGIHGHVMTIIMGALNSDYGTIDFWQSTTKPDIYKLELEGQELKSVTRLWKVPALERSV